MHHSRRRAGWGLGVASGCLVLSLAAMVSPDGLAAEDSVLQLITETSGIKGGLCVQVGCDLATAQALAQSGRFLTQGFESDPIAVARLRENLQAAGRYGLVTVDHWQGGKPLPLAENLVNVLIVAEPSAGLVSPAEAARVLAPQGLLVAVGPAYTAETLKAVGFKECRRVTVAGKPLVAARKAWPVELDQWTHPRHAADGNAVSLDLVAGPPRRVRWVAGPEQEVSSLVSGNGRNYYGGVWARDSFNGLRLWQRDVKPSPAQGNFDFRKTPGSVRPIAGDNLLFVYADSQVQAWDGATGERLRQYPEAGAPSEILNVGPTLLALEGQTLRAVEVDSGRLRWKRDASEPRYVVADADSIFLLEGAPRRGEKCALTRLALADGRVLWTRADYPWLAAVRRTVCHGALVACEVSTLADEKQGNAVHVLSAADGRVLWSRTFVPSMNHMKQARAMFIGDLLWLLEDKKCVGLNPQTGETLRTWQAGLCHCFPPVATARYMFSGEMELTDLATGQFDANRLTKAACGRDAGWVPANGLVYVTPKHCVCWPMLRGYVAMAAAKPGELEKAPTPVPVAEPGPGAVPEAPPVSAEDWPCYRHDAWRSSAAVSTVPTDLRVLWKAELGKQPPGPIGDDWRENPFVRGPLTAPVVAGGAVYVARPDAHQVVSWDARTGSVRWTFTANGRIDTAPTLYRGLCLFGTKSGWVYALRARDGQVAWRLQAAPHEERIVAYGQIESPWPVAGSVLVVDDVAYFAAGRQSLADGGIRMFAVEPLTGKVRWSQRLDTLPTKDFYSCNALEFDNLDLLHPEDDGVAMSRWLFRRTDGAMTCRAEDAFAVFQTDSLSVAVPRGCWTYAPRHMPRHSGEKFALRPLVTFRGNSLIACRDDLRQIFRRDFDFRGGEKFKTAWMTGWAAGENSRKKTGEVYRSDRLVVNSKWSADPLSAAPQQKVAALLLAGEQILLAGAQGGLWIASAADGQVVAQHELPAPIWDGLAVSAGRLYAATADGQLLCLGRE